VMPVNSNGTIYIAVRRSTPRAPAPAAAAAATPKPNRQVFR
jgi:hypothetical protein